MNVTLQEIAQKLKTAKSVAIFSHTRPDGDAYGSSLALSRALEGIGIHTCVCNDSEFPSNLAFCEGVQSVAARPTLDADVYVAVDCAEEARLGELSGLFALGKKKKPTFNIDHHISNTRYAEFNFVRECASNCLNIYQLITDMGAANTIIIMIITIPCWMPSFTKVPRSCAKMLFSALRWHWRRSPPVSLHPTPNI